MLLTSMCEFTILLTYMFELTMLLRVKGAYIQIGKSTKSPK